MNRLKRGVVLLLCLGCFFIVDGMCMSNDLIEITGEMKETILYVDGKPFTGKGVWTDSDSVYKGEWREGTFRNGLRRGKRKFTLFGVTYEGERRNNDYTYVGEFKNDKMHGKGTYKWSSITYVGEFKNNKKHGHGILTDKFGNKYEGEYRDGRKHGQGKYSDSHGRSYEGEYRDGEVYGKGKLTNEFGTYEGDFVLGVKYGQGVQRWPNGHVYEGEFRSGDAHGKGVYRWPNGDVYEGEFKAGKPDGQGVHTQRNEEGDVIAVYEGEHLKGKRHGNLILTDKAKQVFDQKWRKGKLISSRPLTSKKSKSNTPPLPKKGEQKKG